MTTPAAIRQLADAVIDRERADRALVRPALITSLRTTISDFQRAYRPEHAEARVRDVALLKARSATVRRSRESA